MNLIPIYYNQDWLNKIADWRNESKEHLRTGDDTFRENQKSWVEKVSKSGDHYYFIAIGWEGNLELVGYCGLDKIHPVNRTAEISLLIGREWRGENNGKNSVKKLLIKAFNELNLNLIYAETYNNKKFWIKCGFKEEANLRQRKYCNNNYNDSTILSITRDEFYVDS